MTVLVALLTSCTAPREDSQSPPDTSSPTEKASSANAPSTASIPPSASLPANGAPKVASPIAPGRFTQDPCRLVTQEQAKQLAVPWPGKQRQRRVCSGL